MYTHRCPTRVLNDQRLSVWRMQLRGIRPVYAMRRNLLPEKMSIRESAVRQKVCETQAVSLKLMLPGANSSDLSYQSHRQAINIFEQ